LISGAPESTIERSSSPRLGDDGRLQQAGKGLGELQAVLPVLAMREVVVDAQVEAPAPRRRPQRFPVHAIDEATERLVQGVAQLGTGSPLAPFAGLGRRSSRSRVPGQRECHLLDVPLADIDLVEERRLQGDSSGSEFPAQQTFNGALRESLLRSAIQYPGRGAQSFVGPGFPAKHQHPDRSVWQQEQRHVPDVAENRRAEQERRLRECNQRADRVLAAGRGLDDIADLPHDLLHDSVPTDNTRPAPHTR
jgi:hypothetical protein